MYLRSARRISSEINCNDTEYKHTEDYLKRKTIEKYVRCFVDWLAAM